MSTCDWNSQYYHVTISTSTWPYTNHVIIRDASVLEDDGEASDDSEDEEQWLQSIESGNFDEKTSRYSNNSLLWQRFPFMEICFSFSFYGYIWHFYSRAPATARQRAMLQSESRDTPDDADSDHVMTKEELNEEKLAKKFENAQRRKTLAAQQEEQTRVRESRDTWSCDIYCCLILIGCLLACDCSKVA